MNIETLVTHFVTFRRALGEQCRGTDFILRAFCRAVGPRTPVRRIGVPAVAAFLAGTGPITNAWHGRYSALKVFFAFAVSRGHLDTAPLPADPPKPRPTLVPYIYSCAEIRRLLDAIPSARRLPRRIEPATLRAMLLTLYGAGLRRQEVLHLASADVDLPNAVLTIRATKFFKSRLVPVGRDLGQVLGEYARWRSARHPAAGPDGHFFLGRDGAPLSWWPLHHAFARLREQAGVRRSDGGRYQPRLHDLRHTFAVHRLTAWYGQGADVQRLVHHLSVYLGHKSLADTQVYLTLTPELLQQAGTRFERYARREDGDA
jgi:site-specific recombinase XerD